MALFRHFRDILKLACLAFLLCVSSAFATTYNITYELNGGTFVSGVSNTTTYDDGTLKVLGLPTKSGYVFKGWYESSDFTGDPVKWISANSTVGDKTYYAKWGQFESKFQLTTSKDIKSDGTGDKDYFAFGLSASGVFYVDWGDNSPVEVIDRTNNTQFKIYSHTYTNTVAQAYTIKFDGQATGYSKATTIRSDYVNAYYDITPAAIYLGRGNNPRAVTSANEGRTVNAQQSRIGIASISGSLGAIFPTIGGAAATVGLAYDSIDLYAIQPRFYETFHYSNLGGSIPAELFSGVEGQPARNMFGYMFYYCSITGSIPENLFAGISGTPAYGMFSQTFSYCSRLTGSIPANLFAGISGAPAQAAFGSTFSGCTNLGKDTIGGASKYYIPATLFAGIDINAAANGQMSGIVSSTGLLESCPLGTNQATTGFDSYFGGKVACVPNDEIYCKAGLKYDSSTKACAVCQAGDTCDTGFVQKCPVGYAGNATASAGYDGDSTSTQCIIAYTIEYELNGGTNNSDNPSVYASDSSSFVLGAPTKTNYKFAGWCDNADLTENCSLYKTVDTSIAHNQKFYAKWGDLDYKFQITTTNNIVSDGTGNNDRFEFAMSASGVFYVDWGDNGPVEVIDRTNNTAYTTYSHTYTNTVAQSYTIKFDGEATEYSISTYFPQGAAISFQSNAKVAGISGSLGSLFPTIGGAAATVGLTGDSAALYAIQPRFIQTFYGCTNLTGSIPENLFAGVSGAPASSMFYGTFLSCGKLKGSIPENLFAGISGAPADNMFSNTFNSCSKLTGSIPANLFAGISGTPADNMFSNTFNSCRGLSGSIPANLFAGISGAPATSMFSSTFRGCSGLSGSIPANLFAGISGAPADNMFSSTFNSCSGLSGSIPANLFAGISGAPARSMFSYTFYGCSNLTGSIPANLFTGVSGAPAEYMFSSTFDSCRGLTGSIPEDLFTGVSGAPARSMFSDTFYGCSGLTGSIPANLFAGISGAPADNMFSDTFYGCRGLSGSIPANLFAGISGAPADNMFYGTFYGCTNLGKDTIDGASKYYIPATLFAGIDINTTANGQMSSIVSSTGLLSSCPAGSTSQAITGFENYFNGKVACVLNTSVYCKKGELFDTSTHECTTCPNVNACPSAGAVYDCSQFGMAANLNASACITKYTITYNNMDGADNSPENPGLYTLETPVITLYAPTKPGYDFVGWYDNDQFTGSEVQTIDTSLAVDVTLYAKWQNYTITYELNGGTNNVNNPATYTTSGATITLQRPNKENYKFMGWYDNDQFIGDAITEIPSGSAGDFVLFAKWEEFENKFQITTTELADGDTFSFSISAAGTFYVDWGDGSGIEPITRQSATYSTQSYSHTYATGGVKTIRLDGLATGYYDQYYDTPAISFSYNTKLAGISGSLGAVFPTIGGAAATAGLASNSAALYAIQPRFYQTFYMCSNLTGPIPENLFAGISGAPANYIFFDTFAGCSGLTGSIPASLFAGISGDPADSMFYGTFTGCRGLTGPIPENLFAGISGGKLATNTFYYTFGACDNLGRDEIDGDSTYYIPPTLMDYSVANSWSSDYMFYLTGLLTACPSDTIRYYTNFGRVSCVPTGSVICQTGQSLSGASCADCSGDDCPTRPTLYSCPSGTTTDWSDVSRCVQVYTIKYENMDDATLLYSNPVAYSYSSNGRYYYKTDEAGSWTDTYSYSWGLNNPSKNGSNFAGWCDDAALTTNCSTYKYVYFNQNQDITLYAKWEETYNINYELNCGNWSNYDWNNYNPSTYTNLTSASINYQPQRSGYNFLGWCDDEELTQNCDTYRYIDVGTTGDKTFWAKWELQHTTCPAGQYAYFSGKTNCEDCAENCNKCEPGYYCTGKKIDGGDVLTPNDNGMYACPEFKPDSKEGSTSLADCKKGCPKPNFGKDSPFNMDFGSVWYDMNADGLESYDECFDSVFSYSDEFEAQKCVMKLQMTDAELHAELKDNYYTYGFDKPCDYNKANFGLMTCRYNSTDESYTDCSEMVTGCSDADLQSIIAVADGKGNNSEGVIDIELEKKGLDKNTIDWDDFFVQNLAGVDSFDDIARYNTCEPEGFKYCATGTYYSVSQQDCVTCPAGSYCEGGLYDTTSGSNEGIETCPVNTFSATSGQSSCETCPEGVASANNNHTGCSCNNSAFTWDEDKNFCYSASCNYGVEYCCDPGEYLQYGEKCVSCPSGSYCPGFVVPVADAIDGYGAIECEDGYYSNGGYDATVCTACPTGSTSNQDHTGCECPDGYEWNSKRNTCEFTTCPETRITQGVQEYYNKWDVDACYSWDGTLLAGITTQEECERGYEWRNNKCYVRDTDVEITSIKTKFGCEYVIYNIDDGVMLLDLNNDKTGSIDECVMFMMTGDDSQGDEMEDMDVKLAGCRYNETTGDYTDCSRSFGVCSFEDIMSLAPNAHSEEEMFAAFVRDARVKSGAATWDVFFGRDFTSEAYTRLIDNANGLITSEIVTENAFSMCCPSGQYMLNDNGVAACTVCPNGSYCTGGVYEASATAGAVQCPTGSTSNQDHTGCECPDGYEWNSERNTCEFTTCPAVSVASAPYYVLANGYMDFGGMYPKMHFMYDFDNNGDNITDCVTMVVKADDLSQIESDPAAANITGISFCRYDATTGNYTDCATPIQACNENELNTFMSAMNKNGIDAAFNTFVEFSGKQSPSDLTFGNAIGTLTDAHNCLSCPASSKIFDAMEMNGAVLLDLNGDNQASVEECTILGMSAENSSEASRCMRGRSCNWETAGIKLFACHYNATTQDYDDCSETLNMCDESYMQAISDVPQTNSQSLRFMTMLRNIRTKMGLSNTNPDWDNDFFTVDMSSQSEITDAIVGANAYNVCLVCPVNTEETVTLGNGFMDVDAMESGFVFPYDFGNDGESVGDCVKLVAQWDTSSEEMPTAISYCKYNPTTETYFGSCAIPVATCTEKELFELVESDEGTAGVMQVFATKSGVQSPSDLIFDQSGDSLDSGVACPVQCPKYASDPAGVGGAFLIKEPEYVESLSACAKAYVWNDTGVYKMDVCEYNENTDAYDICGDTIFNARTPAQASALSSANTTTGDMAEYIDDTYTIVVGVDVNSITDIPSGETNSCEPGYEWNSSNYACEFTTCPRTRIVKKWQGNKNEWNIDACYDYKTGSLIEGVTTETECNEDYEWRDNKCYVRGTDKEITSIKTKFGCEYEFDNEHIIGESMLLDINGDRTKTIDECVLFVESFGKMSDKTDEMDAKVSACRYNTTTGDYTDCSTTLGLCSEQDLMAMAGNAQTEEEMFVAILNSAKTKVGAATWDAFFDRDFTSSNYTTLIDNAGGIITQPIISKDAFSMCCPAGQYLLNDNGAASCDTCPSEPANTYCSGGVYETSATAGAVQCPNGATVNNDQTGCDCSGLGAGYHWESSTNTCDSCPMGTFWNANNNTCDPVVCPDATYSTVDPDTGLFVTQFEVASSYGSTVNECIAGRMYLEHPEALEGHSFIDATQAQLAAAGMSFAFCKYNGTDAYDADCTPRYSWCEDDDALEFVSVANSDGVVVVMKNLLGLDDDDNIGDLFTVNSADLMSATAIDRCCPDGWVCCGAGTHIDFDAIGTDDQCAICPAGSYCDGIRWNPETEFDDGATKCLAGTYSSTEGATSATTCQSCPKNYTTLVDGATVCIEQYAIVYDLDKGTNNENNPSTYTAESQEIILQAPTRDDYDFAGWCVYDSDTNAGANCAENDREMTVTIPTGSTGGIWLYATWTPKPYTITYNSNGGSLSGNGITQDANNTNLYTQTYTVADIVGIPNSTRSGYIFGGWCPESVNVIDVPCPVDTISEIKFGSGDRTLYATWFEDKFQIITNEIGYNDETGKSDEFCLNIYAGGNFIIDWDDDGAMTYKSYANANHNDDISVCHTYVDTARGRTIRMGGLATEYNTYGSTAIFRSNSHITQLTGSLGAIFPTLDSIDIPSVSSMPTASESELGKVYQYIGETTKLYTNGEYYKCIAGKNSEYLWEQVDVGTTIPRFRNTFEDCVNLTTISGDLFGRVVDGEYRGVSGATEEMFADTFSNTSITTLPETLFGREVNGRYYGVSGSAPAMFKETFSGYTKEGLELACKLTSVPANLFGREIGGVYYGVSGAANQLFENTFMDCRYLTQIPAGLFRGISGHAEDMFMQTFAGEIMEDETTHTNVSTCGLTSIPENLFAGVDGVASRQFNYTFNNCTGLTELPDSLFPNITGELKNVFVENEDYIDGSQSAAGMFDSMFAGCTNLGTGDKKYVPYTLFSNISTENFDSGSMTDIFDGTALKTTADTDYQCPEGMVKYGGWADTFQTDFDTGSGSSAVVCGSLNSMKMVCHAGRYAYLDNDNLRCANCPAGSYCTGENSTGGTELSYQDNGKHECLGGTYSSVEGATSADTCLPCPTDYPLSADGTTDIAQCYANCPETPVCVDNASSCAYVDANQTTKTFGNVCGTNIDAQTGCNGGYTPTNIAVWAMTNWATHGGFASGCPFSRGACAPGDNNWCDETDGSGCVAVDGGDGLMVLNDAPIPNVQYITSCNAYDNTTPTNERNFVPTVSGNQCWMKLTSLGNAEITTSGWVYIESYESAEACANHCGIFNMSSNPQIMMNLINSLSSINVCLANGVNILWGGVDEPNNLGVCAYGGKLTVPDAPKEEGRLFLGWKPVATTPAPQP